MSQVGFSVLRRRRKEPSNVCINPWIFNWTGRHGYSADRDRHDHVKTIPTLFFFLSLLSSIPFSLFSLSLFPSLSQSLSLKVYTVVDERKICFLVR